METGETTLIRWIALLPLLGAAIHALFQGLFRRRVPRAATIAVSCGSIALAFVLAFFALLELTSETATPGRLQDGLFTWVGAGRFSAEAAFLWDPLSAVMTLLVLGMSGLVHVFAIGAMDEDRREDGGFSRLFALLGLFTFASLVLVLADNPLLLFLGWQGVGLAGALLSAFWYADPEAVSAAQGGWIVRRIGDAAFLGALLLLTVTLEGAGHSAVSFLDLQAALPAVVDATVPLPASGPLAWAEGWLGTEFRVVTLVAFGFFVAAATRSAQIPFAAGLAAAGHCPAPAAALVFGAVFGVPGAYLLCRFSFLLTESPVASAWIAWAGVLAAATAALIAIAQPRIRGVLAYGMAAQMGWVFLAIGCGAYTAALFHLVAMAFFGTVSLLGAGSLALALQGGALAEAEPNPRLDRLGGLARRLPFTHWCLALGALAWVGFPFTSGFFSSLQVLLAARLALVPGHETLYVFALLALLLTGIGLSRLYLRIFWGESRVPPEPVRPLREPSRVILVPLGVAAFLAAFGGWIGPTDAVNPFPVQLGNSNSLANFLSASVVGHYAPIDSAEERGLAFVMTLVSSLGIALAWALTIAQPGVLQRLVATTPTLQRLLEEGFHAASLRERFVGKPLQRLSERVMREGVDRRVVDGVLIQGPGRALRALARDMLRFAHSGLVQGGLFLATLGGLAFVGFLLW